MTLVADSARSDEHMAAHRQTMTARAGDNAYFAPGRCVMPARPAPGQETRGVLPDFGSVVARNWASTGLLPSMSRPTFEMRTIFGPRLVRRPRFICPYFRQLAAYQRKSYDTYAHYQTRRVSGDPHTRERSRGGSRAGRSLSARHTGFA